MNNFQGLPSETLHNTDALANYLLEEGVAEEAVMILKGESVTGQTLPDITEDDLKELAIKVGPRKRILQIINLIKGNTAIIEVIKVNRMTEFDNSFNSTIFEDHLILPNEAQVLNTSNISTTLQAECSEEAPNEMTDKDNQVLDDKVPVRSWVMEHPRGSDLIPILNNGVYSAKDRALLVRIVCARMMKLCNSAYPTVDLKERVAKCIVSDFPALRSQSSVQGHEHFYDKNSGVGFIEYRLKTVRKTLSPSKKRRSHGAEKTLEKTAKLFCPNSDIHELLDEEALEEKVMWMQYKTPDTSSKEMILNLLNETRANRQEELKDPSTSLTNILQRYPRLKDYKGEMIDREFNSVCPNCDIFLERFQTFYTPRILAYVNLHRPDLLNKLDDLDDNLRALIFLVEILPSPNYGVGKGKRGKGSSCTSRPLKYTAKEMPHPNLIKIVPAGEDFHAINSQENLPVQPFLICAKTGNQKNFFIRVDCTLIEVPEHPLQAFDILFKMHYAFHIEYSLELTNFYDFIASCILKLQPPRACCEALHTSLLNIKTENHNPSQLQETVEPNQLQETVEPNQLPDIIEPKVEPNQLPDIIELSQLQQTVKPSQLQETVEPRLPLQVEVSRKIKIFYAIEDGIYYSDEFPGEKISFKEFKDFITHEGNYAYYFKMMDEENGYIFKRIADNERLLPIINGKLYCKIHSCGTSA